MKKLVLTMASLVMLASMAFAQETPMLPSAHGLTVNQPAWGGSQIFQLADGWNWWSTYVANKNVTDLEDVLGTSALQIKSTGDFVTYTNGAWQGQLSGIIQNDQMYAIQMNEAAEVTLRGSRASVTDVTISGGNGWNWVGYPVNSPMTVGYALQNYAAVQGDMIKSSTQFATFDATNNVWTGSLVVDNNVTQYMQPGQGYKMLSNQESFSFIYPAVPETRGNVTIPQTRSTEWQPVMASNPTNMNMIAVVTLDNEELRGQDVEIGVFNGETCRGAIRPQYVEQYDRYMVFLTMYGENNEPFSFRMLNHETGDVYESNEASVSYKADGVVGGLLNPFELKFNTKAGFAGALNLFPNPVNRGEMVNLTLPADGTVEVVNVMGSTVKRVRMAEGTQLAADMAPGIYTIKVTDAEGNVYVDKLIVK